MSSQDASDTHNDSLLSAATLTALQLQQQPFGSPSDTPPGEASGVTAPDAVTFSDETSAEQLADVKQALITGDDLLLILGEAGAGKSVLLNQLGSNSGLRIQCFAVKGSPRFSTLNLFAGMLEAFKRKPPEKLKEILDELIPCLQTMVARNTLSAIVLDDAHLVSEAELTQLLSGMLYVNSPDETLMRVALAAPPEFEDRIPELLPEGADLPYSSLTIDGMSPARAADYLGFRLHQAGYTGELPFSERDLSDLVDRSGGFPGELNAAAAELLNHYYGPIEDALPVELLNEKGESFVQTRSGKLGLGVLATILIVGGLIMFMPDVEDNDQRYAVSDQTPETASAAEANKLRLVKKPTVVSLNTENTDAALSAPPAGSPTQSADNTSGPAGQATGPDDSDNGSTGSPESASATNTTQDAPATVTASATENATGNGTGSSAETATVTELAEAVNEATTASPGADAQTPAASNGDIPAQMAEVAAPAADSAANPATIAATDGPDGPENRGTAVLTDDLDADTRPLAANPAGRQGAETPEMTAEVPATALPGTDTPSATESLPDVDPQLADVLESPTWILVQDPALVTVQMSASRDRPSIESFLKRNRDYLQGPNSIYTFERDGDTWYALLHGLFPSFDEAKEAVERMPATAQTNQPWIRNVGRIQAVLKAQ
ncbi:MAG: AAA family ATPase [Granulosicoccus sp.]|nr:AAA family ATPase [Granulosicoccus sp.]